MYVFCMTNAPERPSEDRADTDIAEQEPEAVQVIAETANAIRAAAGFGPVNRMPGMHPQNHSFMDAASEQAFLDLGVDENTGKNIA